MMTATIGRVSPSHRGEYNASTNYTRLDIVSYSGSSYMVLKDVADVTPSVGANYQLMAGAGLGGDSSYTIAVKNGYVGTEAEWLKYIKADGSIQALQQFMTNPAETKVQVPDYGNIPSLQGYISTMFENSGLPATPFITKALMTESELADGDYAIVMDDSIGSNNGSYQKQGGVWKYLGINFGRVSPFNLLTENDTIVSIDNTDVTGFYNAAGTFNPDGDYFNSQVIPVKKGECYVLAGLGDHSYAASVFSMVSEQGAFICSLTVGNNNAVVGNPVPMLSKNLERYSNHRSNSTYAVIIPDDGFIKVTTWDTNPNNAKPILYKTDYTGFLAAAQIQAPAQTLAPFNGVLHTVKIDKKLASELKHEFSLGNKIGFPVSYTSSPYSIVSERYAVTSGQYIHIHSAPSFNLTFRLVFEHENGSFQGSADILTDSTLSSNGAGYVGLNVKSEFTGYFRVLTSTNNTVPFLVGVTNSPIKVSVDYLRHNQSIDFFDNVSRIAATNFDEIPSTASVYQVTGNYTSEDAQYTCSVPYVLKSGDVLEYELEATSYPMLAVVFPYGVAAPDDGTAVYQQGVALNALEVVTLDHKLDWVNSGRENGPKPRGFASKGKVAFCDEDRDSVVIFLRPNKMSSLYEAYGQKTGYKLSVLNKDQYIAKRNAEIADRFTMLSGITADPANLYFNIDGNRIGTGSFPSVLLFKGEVLSYLVNYYGSGVAQRLGYVPSTDVPPVVSIDAPLAYQQVSHPEYVNLPITKDNKQSYRFAQIYCTETCVFTPSVLATAEDRLTSLDTEGMIADKYYPARVIPLKNVVVGENMLPTFFSGLSVLVVPSDTESGVTEQLVTNFNMRTDSLVSFAPKGASIETDSWVTDTTVAPFLAPIANALLRDLKFTSPTHQGNTGVNTLAFTQHANYRQCFNLVSDSVIVVPSLTRGRLHGDTGSPIDALNPIMVGTYEHDMKTISKAEALDYKVTSDSIIRIPETGGITFNFCTTNSISLDAGVWSLMQILQNGKVLAVFNALTNNQGQSTANSIRKNVNIELYNDKYQEVSIQFGDYLEQSEFVLKSYLSFDKGHFKDISSSDFYYALRNAEPYPIGGVLPKAVYDDESQPSNIKARGTPFGFPVELHRGGKFNSLATIRCKKKRANYGMVKGNKNHILMEADWLIKGHVLSWSSADITSFEIREPSMKTYASGDAILPVGFEGVQTSVTRILTWMRECYKGTVNVRDTYADYVDLNTFLDYWLAIMVSGNEDGTRNNFLLGTHGEGIWRVFWYDADASWGIQGTGVKVSTSWEDDNSFFKVFATAMLPELKARYAMHRRLGTINTKRLQDHMEGIRSTIHMGSAKLDVKYWGALNPASGLPWAKEWTAGRIIYLDKKYGFTV